MASTGDNSQANHGNPSGCPSPAPARAPSPTSSTSGSQRILTPAGSSVAPGPSTQNASRPVMRDDPILEIIRLTVGYDPVERGVAAPDFDIEEILVTAVQRAFNSGTTEFEDLTEAERQLVDENSDEPWQEQYARWLLNHRSLWATRQERSMQMLRRAGLPVNPAAPVAPPTDLQLSCLVAQLDALIATMNNLVALCNK